MTDVLNIPMSAARDAGDLVFLSGQVGFKSPGTLIDGGIEAQTRQTIQNIRKALVAEKLDLEDVVKCTIWLTSAGDFAAFNRVYAREFSAPYPARSTVISQLAIPDACIEIEVIAYRRRT